jgi:hypothetical protein
VGSAGRLDEFVESAAHERKPVTTHRRALFLILLPLNRGKVLAHFFVSTLFCEEHITNRAHLTVAQRPPCPTTFHVRGAKPQPNCKIR